MTNLIAIVDGTGDWGDESYAKSMQNSFCVQIARSQGVAVAAEAVGSLTGWYERGPSTEGSQVTGKGMRAASFLVSASSRFAQSRLFLAGYSRGASAAIIAAERLAESKLSVDGMFLFDPVAKHPRSGGEVIPSNVRRVWVVRRSLDPELIEKYDNVFQTVTAAPNRLLLAASKAIKDNPEIKKNWPTTRRLAWGVHEVANTWAHPMRPGFETTGIMCASAQTQVRRAEFPGSHGALGGVGWRDVEEDEPCQVQVARYMSMALMECGFNVQLQSVPPEAEWGSTLRTSRIKARIKEYF